MVVMLILASGHLFAQESAANATPWRRTNSSKFWSKCRRIVSADVRTLGDWTKQQPERRRQLLEMLGLQPLPNAHAIECANHRAA